MFSEFIIHVSVPVLNESVSYRKICCVFWVYHFRYYNSRFDLAKTIGAIVNASDSGYNNVTEQASKLTVAATLLARSLYTLATGFPAPEDLMAEEKSVRGPRKLR